MKRSLIVLACFVFIFLVFSKDSMAKQATSQIDEKKLISSMFWPDDFSFAFDITEDLFEEEEILPSVQEVEQQLKKEGDNPHLYYLLGQVLDKAKDGKTAKLKYAKAVNLFDLKLKTTKLNAQEIVEYATSVERAQKVVDAIKIAEDGLTKIKSNSLLVYRYLVGVYSKYAFAQFFGMDENEMQSSSGFFGYCFEVIAEGEEKFLVRGVAAANDCFDKATFYADQAVNNPSAEAIDYCKRGLLDFMVDLFSTIAYAKSDQELPEEVKTRIFGHILLAHKSQYLGKAFQLKKDEPRVQVLRSLLEMIESIGGIESFFQTSSQSSASALEDRKRKVENERDFLEKLIKNTNPPPADAYSALAWIQFILGESRKDAESSCKKALSLDPGNTNAFNMLMELFIHDQRFDDAIKIATPYAEEDSPQGYLVLASCYARKGKLDKAEEMAQKGLDIGFLSGKKPSLDVALGSILIKQEKYSEGISILKKVVKADNKNTVAVYNLAVGLYLDGQKPQAQDALGIAINNPSKNKSYSKALNSQVSIFYLNLFGEIFNPDFLLYPKK